MISKFLNNKIILIISVLFSANINNINCGDGKEQIELKKGSFIYINGYKLDISGAKFTEEEITNNFDSEEKIIKFIFEKFGDKEINVSKSKKCKLTDLYKITDLTIFPWNVDKGGYKYFDNLNQKNKVFKVFVENIKTTKTMIITLKNKPKITANIYGCKYYMKDEIREAFKKIDTEIKKYNYVTLDIIKNLNPIKTIDNNDIVVYRNKNKNEKYKDTEIITTPNNSINIILSNFEKYYNKRSATIEYVLPENLELEENVITKVDSIEDNFQSDDMYIHKFFKKKYGLEHNKNCILEGFSDKQNKYVKIDNDKACFWLGTKIKIIIKEEVPGVTKKKTKIDKPDKDKIYINLKFDVADKSNFKLKQGINDINSIKVEQGKNYNDLLNIIKGKLGGKDLKEGFKIYKNDKNNEFTTGNLENNITYIVIFVNDDSNFVEEKTKPQEQDPSKTQETSNTEQNNNYDNETTKKGGCSGKNKKKCC